MHIHSWKKITEQYSNLQKIQLKTNSANIDMRPLRTWYWTFLDLKFYKLKCRLFKRRLSVTTNLAKLTPLKDFWDLSKALVCGWIQSLPFMEGHFGHHVSKSSLVVPESKDTPKATFHIGWNRFVQAPRHNYRESLCKWCTCMWGPKDAATARLVSGQQHGSSD